MIGFSNAAFYAGSLFTIPDRMLLPSGLTPITLGEGTDGNAEELLQRPLSYHFLEQSPYENRRNSGEAAYIARLVRDILGRDTGLSIGVVAFSEAQQTEIESALGEMAEEDEEFGARLETEYVREEEDQFCGLFVKNLENVQGDERDIIILSICYGPDCSGRMVMNFGPINQRGGEKRLNVIFSRARQHMAVVTSIRHTAITNDYNDGAAALKNFLHYAECFSRGDLEQARAVLEGLNPMARRQLAEPTAPDAVCGQLAEALRARGHVVDANVGQSRFRCDLAIRAGEAYSLGILIDTNERYRNPNVDERLVTQPEILRAFGWTVVLVLTRDWFHEPDAIIERIERLLRGEDDPLDESEEDPEAPGDEEARPENGERREEPTVSSEVAVARRLEFVQGRSSKFWEAHQEGCRLVLRYGRMGTAGRTLTKELPSEERAARELEKLAGEKLRKGYLESSSSREGS